MEARLSVLEPMTKQPLEVLKNITNGSNIVKTVVTIRTVLTIELVKNVRALSC